MSNGRHIKHRSFESCPRPACRHSFGTGLSERLAQTADGSRVQAAFADLTDAVRANPDDVTAKFDLELLLRLSAKRDVRPVEPVGGGQGAAGKRGGGSGVPGEGY